MSEPVCGAAPAPLHPVPPWALLSPVMLSGHRDPKILWAGDPGWFSSPCSPLQPHFWGSVRTPPLQPYLSLLLGLSSCCLLPLRLGAHCCGHTLFAPGVCAGCLGVFSPALALQCCRVWRSRGWHRAGWDSSVTMSQVCSHPQLLPGGDMPMRYKGLMCSVGLSNVLSNSWGLFLLKILLKTISEVKPGSPSAAQERQDAVTLQQLKVGVTRCDPPALGRCGVVYLCEGFADELRDSVCG